MVDFLLNMIDGSLKGRFCVLAVFLGFLLVCIALGQQPGHEYNFEQRCYIDMKEQIEGLPFECFDNGEYNLSNGQLITINNSFQYPNDKIVHYRNILISIENNNGLAKVVTAFTKDGAEISIP